MTYKVTLRTYRFGISTGYDHETIYAQDEQEAKDKAKALVERLHNIHPQIYCEIIDIEEIEGE